jgi:hypothetical protein
MRWQKLLGVLSLSVCSGVVIPGDGGPADLVGWRWGRIKASGNVVTGDERVD